jgi:hypothetical protein
MPRCMGLLVGCLGVCFFLVQVPAQTGHVYAVRPDGSSLLALTNGDPHTKAVVLYFVATDCPVSNRTFPEMKRVREEFADRGVRFWFVYPNRGETRSGVKAHQQAFDPEGEALLDPSQILTKLARARVTPEVSVLVPGKTAADQENWTPVYTGRVDDRYVRIGLERPSAHEHFAERVINEVLRGAPVEAATGSPVGCAIVGRGQ